MFCKNCGNELKNDQKFCTACGTPIETVQPKVEEKVTEPVSNPIMENNNTYNNTTNENVNAQKGKTGLRTASMVLGIISLVLCFVLNIIMTPLALVGLILGIVFSAKNKKFCSGIVLNSIALIISVLIFVFTVALVANLGQVIIEETENGIKNQIEINGDDILNKLQNKLEEVNKNTGSLVNIEVNKNKESKYDTGYKYVGKEGYGFIKVPEKWGKFYDVNIKDHSKILQFSQGTTWILTMNMFTKEELDVYENMSLYKYANNLFSAIKAKPEVSDAEMKSKLITNKFYYAYTMKAYYSTSNVWIKIWVFQDKDNNIHYISIEGPEEESEYFDLIDTYVIEK